MADSSDLRSEGKNSQTDVAFYQRRQRADRIAKHLCVYCAEKSVLNRVTCYDCSKKQSLHTYRSGLRSFLAAVGINGKSRAALDLLQDIDRRSMPDCQSELLDQLAALLGEALPQ
jgi:hypothetical protein